MGFLEVITQKTYMKQTLQFPRQDFRNMSRLEHLQEFAKFYLANVVF
jgi:hypothetical protein